MYVIFILFSSTLSETSISSLYVLTRVGSYFVPDLPQFCRVALVWFATLACLRFLFHVGAPRRHFASPFPTITDLPLESKYFPY